MTLAQDNTPFFFCQKKNPCQRRQGLPAVFTFYDGSFAQYPPCHQTRGRAITICQAELLLQTWIYVPQRGHFMVLSRQPTWAHIDKLWQQGHRKETIYKQLFLREQIYLRIIWPFQDSIHLMCTRNLLFLIYNWKPFPCGR